jgi:hypothetical protein
MEGTAPDGTLSSGLQKVRLNARLVNYNTSQRLHTSSASKYLNSISLISPFC